MSLPTLEDLEFLPTNSHVLIKILKAHFDEQRLSPVNPALPLDIQFAQEQRLAGQRDLAERLYELLEEDQELQRLQQEQEQSDNPNP